MALMPGALWHGERSPKILMDRYDIVCVHTIVGFAPAHAAHFSVFGDGTIVQSRDTRYRSAANLNGNHRVIAIENEDHGSPAFPAWTGSDVPPLTDAQVEADARILAWAHTEHGVPLQLCPDSRPSSKGLAYHRQGIDGNFGSFRFPGRVPSGENWSSSFGKVCPGDDRIEQRTDILRIAQSLGDDMFSDKDRALLQEIAATQEESMDRDRDRMTRVMARLAKILEESKDDATRKKIAALLTEGE